MKAEREKQEEKRPEDEADDDDDSDDVGLRTTFLVVIPPAQMSVSQGSAFSRHQAAAIDNIPLCRYCGCEADAFPHPQHHHHHSSRSHGGRSTTKMQHSLR